MAIIVVSKALPIIEDLVDPEMEKNVNIIAKISGILCILLQT